MTVTKSPMLIHYGIEYFDENYEETHKVEGLMAAYSYGQAAETLESVYGHDNIISIDLYETVIVMDEDDIREDFHF